MCVNCANFFIDKLLSVCYKLNDVLGQVLDALAKLYGRNPERPERRRRFLMKAAGQGSLAS